MRCLLCSFRHLIFHSQPSVWVWWRKISGELCGFFWISLTACGPLDCLYPRNYLSNVLLGKILDLCESDCNNPICYVLSRVDIAAGSAHVHSSCHRLSWQRLMTASCSEKLPLAGGSHFAWRYLDAIALYSYLQSSQIHCILLKLYISRLRSSLLSSFCSSPND